MLSIVISEGLGKIKLHQKTLWELQSVVSRQKWKFRTGAFLEALRIPRPVQVTFSELQLVHLTTRTMILGGSFED